MGEATYRRMASVRGDLRSWATLIGLVLALVSGAFAVASQLFVGNADAKETHATLQAATDRNKEIGDDLKEGQKEHRKILESIKDDLGYIKSRLPRRRR